MTAVTSSTASITILTLVIGGEQPRHQIFIQGGRLALRPSCFPCACLSQSVEEAHPRLLDVAVTPSILLVATCVDDASVPQMREFSQTRAPEEFVHRVMEQTLSGPSSCALRSLGRTWSCHLRTRHAPIKQHFCDICATVMMSLSWILGWNTSAQRHLSQFLRSVVCFVSLQSHSVMICGVGRTIAVQHAHQFDFLLQSEVLANR